MPEPVRGPPTTVRTQSTDSTTPSKIRHRTKMEKQKKALSATTYSKKRLTTLADCSRVKIVAPSSTGGVQSGAKMPDVTSSGCTYL